MLRIALLVSIALVVLMGGCASNAPDLGPASWYRTTTTIDPPDATIFGPAGDGAIEWQRLPGRGVWIWRENRANGWNQQTVWQVGPQGTFTADVSTGAWSGPVTVSDWQTSGLFSPGGWTYALQLTNGSGQITGSGESDDPGGDDDSGGTGSPLFLVWIKWSWVRPDGSVGARMTQKLVACNEQEYLNTLQRIGAPTPTR